MITQLHKLMRLKLDGDKPPKCELRKAVKVFSHENPREAYEKVADAFLEFCDTHDVTGGLWMIYQDEDDQCVRFTLVLSPGSGS